jgi:hypothetical protein
MQINKSAQMYFEPAMFPQRLTCRAGKIVLPAGRTPIYYSCLGGAAMDPTMQGAIKRVVYRRRRHGRLGGRR